MTRVTMSALHRIGIFGGIRDEKMIPRMIVVCKNVRLASGEVNVVSDDPRSRRGASGLPLTTI